MSGRRRRSAFRKIRTGSAPATRLIHAGLRPDWNAGALVLPIYQTSTFRFPAPYSEAADRGDVYLYTRESNPTQEAAAETIREIEGGGAAKVFGSGMGAITTTILSLLGSGDRVVAPHGLYGGTIDLLRRTAPRLGLKVRWVKDPDLHRPESQIPSGTKLVWLESPTNPTLRVVDLQRWAEAAHLAGAILAVDNTFATPINQRPLRLGADLVLHSATKYLGGHSDLLAGVVVGSRELIDRIDPDSSFGAPLDPFAAFLLQRSLRTLALRMDRHNTSARILAETFRNHPRVARVHYPGWASPTEEAIARRQMSGRGGMLSLSLRGGARAVDPFLRRLELFEIAASLGGVESLVSVPGQTSHRHLSPRELADRGIDPGLVRLSVGLEDPRDLSEDLRRALGAGR